MGVFPKRALQNANFLTTHAGRMKFSGWANIKKRFPKRGSPKLKLFKLLKWIHEMVVHKFSTFLSEATLHFCTISFFRKVLLQCRLDCERIKNATKW